MGFKTGIAWTDHTFNGWRGCQHAVYVDGDGKEHMHQGCLSCYAEKLAKLNPGTLGQWGGSGTRIMGTDAYWRQPLKWDEEAEAAGRIDRVFTSSLADVFEDWQGPIWNTRGLIGHVFLKGGEVGWGPDMHEYSPTSNTRMLTLSDLRRDLFALIGRTPNLLWQVLTKRPQNVLGMWPTIGGWPGQYRRNVHLLTSISTQADADALIPHLLGCRDLVSVLGVSAEPLLGEIDLLPSAKLDWLIIGNESKGHGVGRLPGGTEDGFWKAAKSLVDQCRAAGVPVFFKQGPMSGRTSHDPSEWPEWARLHEFPQMRS